MNFFRGVFFGILFSIPIYAIIAVIVHYIRG